MNAESLATDHARAERIGVSRTTILRIQKGPDDPGGIRPGEDFIAAVLDAFGDQRFENFFKVERVAS